MGKRIHSLSFVVVLLITFCSIAGCAIAERTQPSRSPSPVTMRSSEFPREIAISSIRDWRLRDRAKLSDPNATTVVELAPGVYADRGQGTLSSIDDYASTFGFCVDWNRFRKEHPDAGGSCW